MAVIKETQKNCATGLCSKFNIEQQTSHRPICSGTHSFIHSYSRMASKLMPPPPRPNNRIIIGDKHCHHLSYKSLTFSLSHFLLIILSYSSHTTLIQMHQSFIHKLLEMREREESRLPAICWIVSTMTQIECMFV